MYMPAASWVRPLRVSSGRDIENISMVSPISVCSVISVKSESLLASSGIKYQRISEVCTGGESLLIEKRIAILSLSRPSSERLSASTTGGTVFAKGKIH